MESMRDMYSDFEEDVTDVGPGKVTVIPAVGTAPSPEPPVHPSFWIVLGMVMSYFCLILHDYLSR